MIDLSIGACGSGAPPRSIFDHQMQHSSLSRLAQPFPITSLSEWDDPLVLMAELWTQPRVSGLISGTFARLLETSQLSLIH